MRLPFNITSKEEFWFYGRRAIWILLSWVFISNILFLYEFITLSSEGALTSKFDFQTAFTANMIVAITAGLLGGILIVNLMEIWIRKYAFWKALTLIILTYIITAFFVGIFGALYYYSDYLGKPIYSPEVITKVQHFFYSWLFIKNFIVWLIIVITTLIILMVNDKYGPGVFPDYLMGRYFMPKNEKRIFMFADIRNATGIAEDLGEKRYFNFLKDFFDDIGYGVIRGKGEIYQYVGDEVVVSWKMKKGLRNANFLRCYYLMQRSIRRKSGRYIRKYGYIPEFKVGFHCGTVMVGELGKIKRDIAFSGDVLNTTARIQSLCNEKGVDILLSEVLINLMPKMPKDVKKKKIGKELLRGKTEEIVLFTLVRA